MSYYLGKVGRAGARLVSSCKDLYYDVNAAYLTGAVDIVAVSRPDGTLQSTPFHVRFGKLGVLRTGDWKEVEIEVNGETADLCMMIDESGQAFFPVPKSSESTDASVSVDDKGDHISLDMTKLITADIHHQDEANQELMVEPISSDVLESGQSLPLHKSRDELVGFQEEFTTRPHRSNSDTILLALEETEENSIAQLVTSRSVSERSQSVTEYAITSPMAIEPDCTTECDGLCCSLPDELEVLSDSAVKEKRRRRRPLVPRTSALSDTEVEVKDRLSTKLWDWSDRPKPQASQGETSSSLDSTHSIGETKERELKQATSMDRPGFWGALTGMLGRRHYRRFSSVEDGVYLDDLDGESMDPEELSKFFPSSSVEINAGAMELLGSSGLGSSATPSPTLSPSDHRKDDMHKIIHTLEDVRLSLCGGLSRGNITEDLFASSQVSFEEFCSNPAILSNPNLVVMVEGIYYNWQVAAPMILSAISYLRPLPETTRSELVKKHMPKKLKSRQSFWHFWGRGRDNLIGEDSLDGEIETKAKSEGGTPIGSPRKWMEGERDGIEVLSSDEEQLPPPAHQRIRQRSLRRKKFTFTSRPSTEQLKSLRLQPGANKIVFSITTKYQGTAKAQCTLYLWNYNDKVVISDIDGTITRSDVAGQVLPLFGKDWTQDGVVELFSSIDRNGYRIVYLSARAIGQAWYTKEFLRNVRRNNVSLPDGPLFLTPTSLYHAFRKEVIERKPEEFKIECLEQIRKLFSDSRHPLHAGFGNKYSDVKAYTSVGIPTSRIFTVNHRGNLKYELSWTFQSSYAHMMTLIDAQFPPLEGKVLSDPEQEAKEDFTTFKFWREPIFQELPFDLSELS